MKQSKTIHILLWRRETSTTATCGSGDKYVINGAINCRHAYQGLRSCKISPEHSTYRVWLVSWSLPMTKELYLLNIMTFTSKS